MDVTYLDARGSEGFDQERMIFSSFILKYAVLSFYLLEVGDVVLKG